MITVIEQGAYLTQINKTGAGKFTAKSAFLGTRFECDAVLFADACTMTIDRAVYCIHRTPGNQNLTEEEIPELSGAPALSMAAGSSVPCRIMTEMDSSGNC